jgi:signal transduction histidine kinase/CheY-like chemotaxis protein
MKEGTARGAEKSEQVLVWMSGERNATLTSGLLLAAGIATTRCLTVEDFCHGLASAGAGVLVDELLVPPAIERIAAELALQPAWSDFPLVLLRTGSAATKDARDELLGNVTIVDRPVHVRTMVAAVRAALRSRRRQYDSRSAIEARDQFLAMLGHELRNPLGAVQLAADLLGRTKDETPREQQRAVIERQVNHLARLVDDMLDVARIMHGKVALHRQPLELAEVIRGCVRIVRPAAEHAEISVTLVGDAGSVMLLGDRLRLEQVFSNLLTNAVKYTPAGGTICVALEASEREAVVRVTDTGIGIAPEMLPRVFDVFAQADTSLDRAHGGLGLGLAVVRSLVRLHDGEVEATSDGLGHGTEFVVRLPRTVADVRLVRERASPSDRPRRQRIVVVEDNEDMRTLTEQLLVFEGHEVWTAADVPSGQSLIAEKVPDIAFVDIGLPGFDGYELARRVRAQGLRMRLVAMTGYGQPEEKGRALGAGFDRHLTKPVGVEALQVAMGERAQ